MSRSTELHANSGYQLQESGQFRAPVPAPACPACKTLQARLMYYKVLPLPVTPVSKNSPPCRGPLVLASMLEIAACCAAVRATTSSRSQGSSTAAER